MKHDGQLTHEQAQVFNDVARAIYLHHQEKGFWTDPDTGEDLRGNKWIYASKIALIHSEISESLEGHRKKMMDDKLSHRKQDEVELADAVIRIFDLADGFGMDLGGAIAEKMSFNARREDHKMENRQKEGGKKF